MIWDLECGEKFEQGLSESFGYHVFPKNGMRVQNTFSLVLTRASEILIGTHNTILKAH